MPLSSQQLSSAIPVTSDFWTDTGRSAPFFQKGIKVLKGVNGTLQELPWTGQMISPKVDFRDQSFFNAIDFCWNDNNTLKQRMVDTHSLRRNMFIEDTLTSTTSVSAYIKDGELGKAQRVFKQLPARDIVSWNTLIMGYVRNGFGDEALKCFTEMLRIGVSPNAATYACILKACGIVTSLEVGKGIHAEIRKQGLLHNDAVLCTAVVDMYSKCGSLAEAQKAFDQVPIRDVVTWSAMIAGYAQHGFGEKALTCFWQMQDAGICPNVVTYVSTLKACGVVGSRQAVEQIDAQLRKQMLLRKYVVLGTALVDTYSKCGALEKAQEVFDQLPMPNVVSWSVLITGFVLNGHPDDAMKYLRKMKDKGVYPDVVMYICVLKACGVVTCLIIGKQIDEEIRKRGLLHKHLTLGNTLVDMYCKCGELEKACEVFEQLPERDVVSWNVLIAGYVHNGLGDKALRLFQKMQDVGTSADVVTYVCTLKACGIVGSLELGKKLDDDVRKEGLFNMDLMVGNTLIDMYSKCGALEQAREVFKHLPARDVISWSAIISGYALLGYADLAFDVYRQMTSESVTPNSITFNLLLTACSHAGLVMEGENLFKEMYLVHNLTPTLEHYTCVMDIFGRAGCFDNVNSLLEKLSQCGHLPLFLTTLGACRKWTNVEIGRRAFEQSVKLDEKCAAIYLDMENIYAAAGMQTQADRTECTHETNKLPVFKRFKL